MRLTVISGEHPELPGTVLEAHWTVPLEVVVGEFPWELGRRLVATMNEPPEEPEAKRE